MPVNIFGPFTNFVTSSDCPGRGRLCRGVDVGWNRIVKGSFKISVLCWKRNCDIHKLGTTWKYVQGTVCIFRTCWRRTKDHSQILKCSGICLRGYVPILNGFNSAGSAGRTWRFSRIQDASPQPSMHTHHSRFTPRGW